MTGPVGTGCGDLELIAQNGTYLGAVSSNPYASDGVCNEFSTYGNPYSATSIYNEFGTYGSQYAAQSAYNTLSTTPPAIVCSDSGDIIAFVTKNKFVTGAQRIDPDALCAVLANSGL
jgi:hypothetical protein